METTAATVGTVGWEPLNKRHLFLAGCFNILCVSNLIVLYVRFHSSQPYLPELVILLAWLLAYAGWYMNFVFRANSGGEAVERLRFIAFRLYLISLCLTFVCLAAFLHAETPH